ncbi:MAG: hypothetical protein JNK57_04700 [Planctomycetaceae bacterium]|nr:hypothetical protein [Planctomycetaceae bacterium]
MRTIGVAVWIAMWSCSQLAFGLQDDSNAYSWRYYRPSNTGIQGDYCEALLLDSDGNPWIAGYEPSFEEGGFSKFHYSQNRWENYSNVDFPEIGHPFSTGVTRVADFDRDSLGNLWMATGRGALFFSPALGPVSLQRFDGDNSPMPGGWNRGVEVAPDGTVWFSAYATYWGGSGVSQYDPTVDQWRVFSNPFGDGKINVQPKPNDGYFVWVNATGLEVNRYDSSTHDWQTLPAETGGPAHLVGKNATDSQGNTWMLRWTNFDLYEVKLDCLRPDGTWFNFPAAPFGNDIAELRAKSPDLVLVVDGSGRVWRFNGSTWQDLGSWNDTSYSYDIDQDVAGNVWACGVGGAGRRDVSTGEWQRFRVTNTSQYDFFNEDLTINQAGHVWATANAGPGVGGMVKFDGQSWTGFNNHHYGLGYDWPFPTDNSQKVYVRPVGAELFVNPTFGGLHQLYRDRWTNMQVGWDEVGDIREDGSGRLWVAHAGGLLLQNRRGWQMMSRHGADLLRADNRFPKRMWAMSVTNVIWLGDSKSPKIWTIEDFPELDPQSDQFKGMVQDSQGNIWIGANTINLPFNSTLIKLNPRTGKYVTWRYGVNWPFPGQYLMPVGATSDGKIWFQYDSDFGIDDQGLGSFDGTQIRTFPAPFEGAPQWGGLPHAGIKDVEVREMTDGYELWISCASRGIAVLRVTR